LTQYSEENINGPEIAPFLLLAAAVIPVLAVAGWYLFSA
jgi:nitrate reductase NapE component